MINKRILKQLGSFLLGITLSAFILGLVILLSMNIHLPQCQVLVVALVLICLYYFAVRIFRKNQTIIWGIFIGLLVVSVLAMQAYAQRAIQAKPVIYLYPTQKQSVTVQLNYQGHLLLTYPVFNKKINGWKVTAYPDGRIVDSDLKEYSYLFWEGVPRVSVPYDLSKGFVVKGNIK